MKHGDIVKVKDVLGKIIISEYESKGSILFLPLGFGSYYESELEEIKESDILYASHEEKLEYLKTEYSFGEGVAWHCIGQYQILECKKHDEITYHAYINYKDTCCSYTSLDSALIGVICLKYDGANTRATGYIYRMLDIK